MPGLIIKLRPYEAVMVNGAVIENGSRESRLRIATEDAKVLRLREALKPEEATTPVRRAYFIAQQAVSGELEGPGAADKLSAAIMDLKADADNERLEALNAAHSELRSGRYYGVMRALGAVMRKEDPPAQPEGQSSA